MAKDKETPEEVEELSGWEKLHRDYLARKEKEEKERKEQEEKERREILKTVPKKDGARPKEGEEKPKTKKAKKEPRKIPFVGKKREPKPKKRVIEMRHILRALPVLVGFSLSALVAIYFLTPLATQKEIQVSGNKEVSSEAILSSSAINDQDYAVTTLLSQAGYARNIRQSSPWIESVQMSYRFPNRFGITVKEFDVVAYEVRDGQHYPVLTNGVVVETPTEETRAQTNILIQFSDQPKIADFVKQLETVPAELKGKIKSVELTPSKATPDLLTVTMDGDHRVILPLSELSRKLAYYDSIVGQLSEPNVIDMESGIYSYSQAEAARKAAEEAKAREENPENQDENAETNVENVDQTLTQDSQEIGT